MYQWMKQEENNNNTTKIKSHVKSVKYAGQISLNLPHIDHHHGCKVFEKLQRKYTWSSCLEAGVLLLQHSHRTGPAPRWERWGKPGRNSGNPGAWHLQTQNQITQSALKYVKLTHQRAAGAKPVTGLAPRRSCDSVVIIRPTARRSWFGFSNTQPISRPHCTFPSLGRRWTLYKNTATISFFFCVFLSQPRRRRSSSVSFFSLSISARNSWFLTSTSCSLLKISNKNKR